MSNVIESIERKQLRRVPNFRAGDRVRVHFQVVEGTRKRTQVFEGVVIKRQGSGARETFTVRKQSFGVGVERTFPVHSPKIEQLEIAGRGEVRRAKLYYLRGRVGKRARVAERRWAVADDVLPDLEEPQAMDAAGETVAEAETEAAPEEPAEGEGTAAASGETSEPEAAQDPTEPAAPGSDAEEADGGDVDSGDSSDEAAEAAAGGSDTEPESA